MNQEQEEKVLETFKWKNIYQSNLEDMFLRAYDCELTVEILESDIKDLKKINKEIVNLYEKDIKDLKEESSSKDKKITNLTKQKKFWRVVAIVEAGVIGAAVVITTIVIMII